MKLKKLLQKRNISQAKVAKKVGVNLAMFNLYLNDRRNLPVKYEAKLKRVVRQIRSV